MQKGKKKQTYIKIKGEETTLNEIFNTCTVGV